MPRNSNATYVINRCVSQTPQGTQVFYNGVAVPLATFHHAANAYEHAHQFAAAEAMRRAINDEVTYLRDLQTALVEAVNAAQGNDCDLKPISDLAAELTQRMRALSNSTASADLVCPP